MSGPLLERIDSHVEVPGSEHSVLDRMAFSPRGVHWVLKVACTLARNEATPDSFAVSLAARRLQREGVPIRFPLHNPEQGLYDALCKTSGELAHARYGAYLAQVASFADALRLKRLHGQAS